MNVAEIPKDIIDRINEYDRNLDRWTYYELLYITKNATDADVKKSYRKLVQLMHPDRYGYNLDPDDKEKLERIFNEINLAYNALMDKSERAKYDQSLYTAENQGVSVKVSTDVQVARAQYHRGIKALQSKEIVPAIEFFRSAAQLDSSNPEYFAKLALALSSHPNPRVRNEAIEAAKEAIRINQENSNYHALLGRVYQKLDDPFEAEVHYRRALTWNPHHHRARLELKEIAKEKEQMEPPGFKKKLKRFFSRKKS